MGGGGCGFGERAVEHGGEVGDAGAEEGLVDAEVVAGGGDVEVYYFVAEGTGAC
jgi:hypothetical protein